MAEVVQVEKAAFDELATAVATLTQSVTEMKNGKQDQATVEKVAALVLEKQAEAAKAINKVDEDAKEHGYKPEDSDGAAQLALPASQRLGKSGLARIQSLHGGAPDLYSPGVSPMSNKTIARIAKREVEDIVDFQQACDSVAILNALCVEYTGHGGLPAR